MFLWHYGDYGPENRHGCTTCSVIQAKASMTRATTSERRMARNARFTDKASVKLPDEATTALLLIPAVSISRNFCKQVIIVQVSKRISKCNKFIFHFSLMIRSIYRYKSPIQAILQHIHSTCLIACTHL